MRIGKTEIGGLELFIGIMAALVISAFVTYFVCLRDGYYAISVSEGSNRTTYLAEDYRHCGGGCICFRDVVTGFDHTVCSRFEVIKQD